MEKECGLSFHELMNEVGFLEALDNGQQITLARILEKNNETIKEYVDQKTSPKNVSRDVASEIVSGLKAKGMNF